MRVRMRALALGLVFVLASLAGAEKLQDPLLDCSNMTTCHSCVMYSSAKPVSCGWCGSSQKCLAGLMTGPIGAYNCTSWDFSFCTGEPCETYTNPYSCQKDPFCIWCLDPTMCMEGAFGRPAFMECERLATDNLEDIRGAFPMSIAPERTPTVDKEGYESTRMPDDIDAR